jgi:hypothetical protein
MPNDRNLPDHEITLAEAPPDQFAAPQPGGRLSRGCNDTRVCRLTLAGARWILARFSRVA